jgi:uncharacterized protein (TIGR02145 family)
MEKIFLFILFSCLISVQLFSQNHAPVIDSVRFSQRTDNLLKVDIYYTVYDEDGDTLTVSAFYENTSLPVPFWVKITNIVDEPFSNDFGEGIVSGNNKHFVWDFKAQMGEVGPDEYKIKVIASDGWAEPCPGISTVNYSGKTYKTVQIGDQCWLKENLDAGTMIQSSSGSDNQTDNDTTEKYCYDNNPENCEIYGGLYQWNEAMQYSTIEMSQGICPDGWHIPGDTEFQKLSGKVSGNSDALKTVGQGNGTNISGFSALLAGSRSANDGSFNNLGGNDPGTAIWSSNENSTTKANYMYVGNDNDNVVLTNYSMSFGFSVRCLKDE